MHLQKLDQMGFRQKDVDDLLVRCKRSCCICHRFCGIKIETDHIVQESEGGSNSIDNAIALCFECHAEVHLYNDKHPRGRKYHPNELKKHKVLWLRICKKTRNDPNRSTRAEDPGPLYTLLSELEFNRIVTTRFSDLPELCPLETQQFQRAMSEGIFSVVDETLRDDIMVTYGHIKTANTWITKIISSLETEYEYSDRTHKSCYNKSTYRDHTCARHAF